MIIANIIIRDNLKIDFLSVVKDLLILEKHIFILQVVW